MITIEPYLEFYITNVCNLACNGCNRFNNFPGFKGHQRWNDHKYEYAKWAKRITSPFITILGGEPTLNPDLELYASSLRVLWPDSNIMIQSNGSYKREIHDMYWRKYRVGMSVSLHDASTADILREKWKGLGYTEEAFDFREAAVISINGQYVVHNNKPQLAFAMCDMRYNRTMFNGKLYKCPTMATLPELHSRVGVALSEEDEDLLNQYKPLSADCTDLELQQFVSTKDVPIEQCKFCTDKITKHVAIPIKSL